eukprot:Filipodium_phascolosomae@DN2280_c0_g1_i2.p1
MESQIIGINRWRRHLVRKAEGVVLETAAGTCRNFSYFTAHKVKSITVTDFSRPMLQRCLQKIKHADPIRVDLKLLNSNQLEFEDDSFDTTIDTFGLCSYEKPVEALKELSRVTKKTGKILLLEHGASEYVNWINRRLKKRALRHAVHHGCWFNRDIKGIVQKAGLTIDSEKTMHFGTLYMLICTPSNNQQEKCDAEEPTETHD